MTNTTVTTSDPTIRTVTVAAESDLEPDAVLVLLADPTRLPEWAPAFAHQVEAVHGDEWDAVGADGRFRIHVLVSREWGTVDVLRDAGPGERIGTRLRTVPRPHGGSVTTMTMPTFPGTPEQNRRAAQDEVDRLVALAAAMRG